MLDQIMNSTNFNYLPRAMTAASMRQEVIANNIANSNTPNFRKSNVEFEDVLAREIYGEKVPEGKLQMVRTHDRHLPFKPIITEAVPKVVEDDSTIMRVDNNNVDIDIEMATLAKNQIYYNALSTELGGYVSKMRNAITSGQS
ncbi:MAG: flagellar basal body rod protein FlgB [Selenomonadaceae bacterium]|nr:flagellar basal body rod protein FlgB [Selenomonadaceae bacterium]